MDGTGLKWETGGKDIPASERLPRDIRSFFWDVDPDRLSIVESAHFIIGRLMEHGDEKRGQIHLKKLQP